MTVLVIGVPDSGKSAKAEEIAVKLSGGGKKLYIATMIPFGEEGKRRIEKHRKLREGKNFETTECPFNIKELAEKDLRIKDSTCLLECMSNLIGNEMHLEDKINLSDDDLVGHIIDSVVALKKNSKHLVIVSNSFPLDEEGYDWDTKRYTKLVAMVNEELKIIADEVHEFVDDRWS